MKNVKFTRSLGVALALVVASACAHKQVDPATLSPDDLYRRATEAYEAGKLDRAIPMLTLFADQHVGDERAPRARMMLGRAYLRRREYVTAASEFQRLVEGYPTSPLNLEARYAICDAYLRLSPKPALDQEYTRAALAHCESVATNFPGTPEAEKAAKVVTDLNRKLAQKAYDTGVFYMKRKAFDAAVVYFNEVLARYPQTALAPAALQQLESTYRTMGYVEEATQARERLLKDYPDSPEARGVRPDSTARADTTARKG